MRVIAGIAKGRKLISVKNNSTRPTENRVKEALFSIVHFKIQNSCVLDLFAGSGQIAIEALSRGAKFCTLVDNSPQAYLTQKTNLKTTGFFKQAKIILSDCIKFLEKTQNKFDFIFIDPPYKSNLIIKTLNSAQNKLNKNGSIICEHEANLEMPSNFCNIELKKQYNYGKMKLTLYNSKEI